MTRPEYLSTIVLTPERDFVVALLKKRGAVALVDKITFPSGQALPGESRGQAASRILLELSSLEVSETGWRHLGSTPYEDGTLHRYVATHADIYAARQCLDEPVFPISVVRHLGYAKVNPKVYASDFRQALAQALAVTAPFEGSPRPFQTVDIPCS